MQSLLLILLFFAGLAGRRLGWLTPRHAGLMLSLVMMVGLPALFIANINRLTLHRDLLLLPAIAIGIVVVTWGVASLVGRAFALPRPTLGAFIVCAMAINVGFEFPFILAAWDEAAFAQLALFDLGNTLTTCTVLYATAAHYGGHDAAAAAILRRVVSFPPLWALVLALALKLGGVLLPELLLDALSSIGRSILLLVLIALGILFDAKHIRSPVLLTAVGLRIIGGLLLGLLFANLLDLQGTMYTVVLLGAAAPIGFNSLVMANREHLDREFAASAASLSVLLGLVYVPLALYLRAH